MARRGLLGFECGVSQPISTSLTTLLKTDVVRSGTYSLGFNSGGGRADWIVLTSGDAVTEVYVRFAAAIANVQAFEFGVYLTNNVGDGPYIKLYGDTAPTLKFTGFSDVVGSVGFTLNQWRVIEVHWKMASSGGVVEWKIDGVAQTSMSGNCNPNSGTWIKGLSIYVNSSWYTIWRFDDLALNDTSGSLNNSWCGDGKIFAIRPNGNGDVSQLTGSDGNSVDNYLHVDEVGADGDTSYVQSSTLDQYDLYALADITLPANTEIKAIQAHWTAKEDAANGDKIAFGLKTGGTEYWNTEQTLTTNYAHYVEAPREVNPSTANKWTATEINALQAGVKAK